MEFGQTEWVLGVQLAYVVGIISICLIVIFDTRSVSKTLAYLLLVIFVPIAGAIFYFSFGINYRKRKIYSKKLIADGILAQEASEKLKASNHAAPTLLGLLAGTSLAQQAKAKIGDLNAS